MRSGDLELINYKNIIQTIETLGNPSRATVAKTLDLSKTTLTNVVNVLIEKGYVEEVYDTEKERATRGRPGLGLRIKEGQRYALGASFDNYCWSFVITHLNGKIVQSFGPYKVEPATPENLIETLISNIKPIVEKYKRSLLPAIGLGLPGIVDTDKNIILVANDMKWHSPIEVGKAVEKATGFTVYSVNRFTASGLAEYRYANPEGEKNLIYLGIGQGIRSAIFVDGKLLRGATYSAGRVAHITVDPNGPLCDCGRKGCLLTYANTAALYKNASILLKKEKYKDSKLFKMDYSDVTEFCKIADSGDECAKDALDTIATPIATILKELCDIINPQKVILGGPIGYSSEYLRDRLLEILSNDQTRDLPHYLLSIHKAKLEKYGSALGAASLVLENKTELLFKIE